jgi:DNA mismatch repair protein MutS
MEPEFLERAYLFRNKYFPDNKGELSHSSSPYNSRKLRAKCEICKEELAEEIHHLNPQQNADENGFIGTFHKNHKANLAGVCEKCHRDIHTNSLPDKVVKKKIKTTGGYIID